MSHISTRICVPNLVAIRRSCRKGGGGGYRHTDKGKLQLYIIDNIIVIRLGSVSNQSRTTRGREWDISSISNILKCVLFADDTDSFC